MSRLRAPERRRQLLETAAELFARTGYHATTTAELASAAGVSEPILYHHFKNKLDLFVSLIDEVGSEVLSVWQGSLEDADEPKERLRVLLNGNPATHKRGKGIYRVIFQAMSETHESRRIYNALKKHVTQLQRFVEDELHTLQNEGYVRKDIRAGVLAAMLVDMATGYGIIAPLGVPDHAGRGKTATLPAVLETILLA